MVGNRPPTPPRYPSFVCTLPRFGATPPPSLWGHTPSLTLGPHPLPYFGATPLPCFGATPPPSLWGHTPSLALGPHPSLALGPHLFPRFGATPPWSWSVVISHFSWSYVVYHCSYASRSSPTYETYGQDDEG